MQVDVFQSDIWGWRWNKGDPKFGNCGTAVSKERLQEQGANFHNISTASEVILHA